MLCLMINILSSSNKLQIQMMNGRKWMLIISELEKEDYKEKSYNQLKIGKYKIKKNANNTFICLFCERKKKQAFQFIVLLKHASRIATCSSKRRIKVKAKHLALAKYLKRDLVNELDNSNSQAKPNELEKAIASYDEMFVWPWIVIIENIFEKLKHEPEDCDSKHWLRNFEL